MPTIVKVDVERNRLWIELATGTMPGFEVRVLRGIAIFEDISDLSFTVRGLEGMKLFPGEVTKLIEAQMSGAIRHQFR